MSNITIKLTYDKETGKREILLDYDKDGSMTPIEHEKRHRQILKQLLGKGILSPDDLDHIRVGRVEETRSGPSKESSREMAREAHRGNS